MVKIRASAQIFTRFTRRHRSAYRYGILEGSSSRSVDERVKSACGLSEVWFGLAHAQEDFGSCGAAGLSAATASEEAEAGGVSADHRADSGGGSRGSEEAAAHGPADL